MTILGSAVAREAVRVILGVARQVIDINIERCVGEGLYCAVVGRDDLIDRRRVEVVAHGQAPYSSRLVELYTQSDLRFQGGRCRQDLAKNYSVSIILLAVHSFMKSRNPRRREHTCVYLALLVLKAGSWKSLRFASTAIGLWSPRLH